MTVTQKDNQISIETKITTEQGEQTVPDSYTLDAKESDFTPKLPSGVSGKGKRIAKRTSDGIEVSDVSTFDTPNGAATIKMTRK